MRIYRPPLLSRVALWVAHRLPDRVWAACAIGATHLIDDHLYPIEHHDQDGSIMLFDGIDAVKIENLRRRLWREWLHAPAIEYPNRDQKPAS